MNVKLFAHLYLNKTSQSALQYYVKGGFVSDKISFDDSAWGRSLGFNGHDIAGAELTYFGHKFFARPSQ
ncbi:unnamed protein product [Didymodactylos carnosus]|uniref:Uncharacterized protein n=1 Tax=Didymodactylos carnosus TaxID=1234261 RepID=A0A8S2GRN6_9BILA|nr:unnamed protein product [Didymodactylos carnosus]CAF3532633.1 unnamed protein product [Didymodactylos carnosus]